MGHAAYPDAKAKGNNSMLRKREQAEDVYASLVPQDPRDMVRTTLFESQFPVAQRAASRLPRPQAGPPLHRLRPCESGQTRFDEWIWLLSGRWTMDTESIQGNKRGTYVALLHPTATNHGIAYGARALWRRSFHSSRRSNDRPGRTGKPFTGRREAGVVDQRMERIA